MRAPSSAARTRLHALGAAVAALLAASASFGAPGAQAAQPTIRIDSPSDVEPLKDPVIHVAGEASMPTGGTVTGQLTIEVKSLDGHGGQSVSVNVNGNRVPFGWDYPTSYNGRYEVVVTAYGRDGTFDQTPNERGVANRIVAVDAKPAPPTGVAAKPEKSRAVTVTWNPNSEPDLVGYVIERRRESDGPDAWSAVGQAVTTSFVDDSTSGAGGLYHYRVVAVRSSSSPNQGVPSDPSDATTADVPKPPTPTTTPSGGGFNGSGTGGNGPGGGGNGTGGGGNGSGTGGGGTNPDLARTGKVDLSGFASLLQNSQTPGARPGQPRPDDGTYDENLPFKPGEGGEEELGEDGTALGIGLEEAGSGAERSPLAFVAASLLVTVILMHLLWLKREVDKAPLPAVTPEEPSTA